MSVVQLADLKAYMNITVATTDAELQLFLNASEFAIAKKCGPLVSTAFTKRVHGNGKPALIVPRTPLLTLVSVTPVNGVALDVTKLNADSSGVIEYLAGGTFDAPFYDVSYTAGRTTTPPDLLEAVKEHTRHRWESQIGGTRRPGSASTSPQPASVFLFSPRVSELMGLHLQDGFS